ncbi:MAG: methionyl-tRNA formyltransferase, partial [Anaerolineae bacterium]|nr:methionyl-tRNA formyltransferase [Anaerolineae bacterium]
MSYSNTRVLYMSTPEFGVPTLQKIVAAGYEVVGVVCQPDRPAGRGLRLTAPPVKEAALALGLPVLQPAGLRTAEAHDLLAATQPDLIVVAAYGQYIPEAICRLARAGALNLHPSLLPRWRGASPVQAAILAGDAETGVTVHFVTAALDAGDILAQVRTPILPHESAGELMARLAALGADLMVETMGRWLRGEISPQPQDEAAVTWSSRLNKEEGLLDWSRPAELLARQVRAFSPWPGAYTFWQGRQLTILEAQSLPAGRVAVAPGEVAA